VPKSFRTGRLERELQMVELSATWCSCIAISWVSLVSFVAMTLCVASRRVYHYYCYLFRYRLSPETFGYTLLFCKNYFCFCSPALYTAVKNQIKHRNSTLVTAKKLLMPLLDIVIFLVTNTTRMRCVHPLAQLRRTKEGNSTEFSCPIWTGLYVRHGTRKHISHTL
jgi:hypothetical protein